MLSWLGSSLSSSLASSTSPPSNQPPNPIGHRPAPSPAPPPGASARSAAPDRPPAPAPAPLIGSDAGAADTSTSLTHSRPGSSADEEDEHAAKRRKGLTGAALLTLSGALDAAIFTSALGYSAYQLWKHPPNHDDVDLALSRSKSVAGPVGGAANANPELPPPPYSAVVSSTLALATDWIQHRLIIKLSNPLLLADRPAIATHLARRVARAQPPQSAPHPHPTPAPGSEALLIRASAPAYLGPGAHLGDAVRPLLLAQPPPPGPARVPPARPRLVGSDPAIRARLGRRRRRRRGRGGCRDGCLRRAAQGLDRGGQGRARVAADIFDEPKPARAGRGEAAAAARVGTHVELDWRGRLVRPVRVGVELGPLAPRPASLPHPPPRPRRAHRAPQPAQAPAHSLRTAPFLAHAQPDTPLRRPAVGLDRRSARLLPPPAARSARVDVRRDPGAQRGRHGAVGREARARLEKFVERGARRNGGRGPREEPEWRRGRVRLGARVGGG